jgi:hypothetical protein
MLARNLALHTSVDYRRPVRIVEACGSRRDIGAAYARVAGDAMIVMRSDAQTHLAGKAPSQPHLLRQPGQPQQAEFEAFALDPIGELLNA